MMIHKKGRELLVAEEEGEEEEVEKKELKHI